MGAKRDRSQSAARVEDAITDEILRAIRRILQKTAEYSRQLARDGDLTVAQLLCLRKISTSTRSEPLTGVELARELQLSKATVSRILDRLEAAELIVRERSTVDRRDVFVRLTPKGRQKLSRLPTPLHEEFVVRLRTLPEREQQRLLGALEQIVDMMGAADLDAAPMLTPGTDVRRDAR